MVFNFLFCLAVTVVLFDFCDCFLQHIGVGITNNRLGLLKVDFLHEGSVHKEADLIEGKDDDFVFDVVVEFFFQGLNSLQNLEANFTNVEVKEILVQDVLVNRSEYYYEYLPNQISHQRVQLCFYFHSAHVGKFHLRNEPFAQLLCYLIFKVFFYPTQIVASPYQQVRFRPLVRNPIQIVGQLNEYFAKKLCILIENRFNWHTFTNLCMNLLQPIKKRSRDLILKGLCFYFFCWTFFNFYSLYL